MYVEFNKFTSNIEEANSEQIEEFKSMSRVFIVSFVLQFLLLTNSTKVQLTEEENSKMKKKETSQKLKKPSKNIPKDNTQNDLYQEEEVDIFTRNSSSKKKSDTSSVQGKLNFFLLQEAARMELTRTMEYLTDALLNCDRNVIMGANQDNFMRLIAHLRDPFELRHSHFFNIPSRFTFLDFMRYKSKEIQPSRYIWDSSVQSENCPLITSFASVLLKPRNEITGSFKKAEWENGTTLIETLLNDVSAQVRYLDKYINEAREIYLDLVSVSWNERPTKDSVKIKDIFRDHLQMLKKIISYSFASTLLKRTTTHDQAHPHEHLIQDFETLIESHKDPEEEDIDGSFRKECLLKLLDFHNIEYSYKVTEEFFVTTKQDKSRTKETLPFNDNVENLVQGVESLQFLLVSITKILRNLLGH